MEIKNTKITSKQVKQRFSIRIGRWELCLWEILYEAPTNTEPAEVITER